ncbi:MAG: zinc dependent phospholipase C family protein [Planctomycetota bacterium]
MLVWTLALALTLALTWTWGPGTHLEYAARVHTRRDQLPADRGRLIDEQREAYDYGNLAADIINFKAYGGHYNHCHRWTIVDDMRAEATTEREEAFILGYLSHLAADTIAHNHFVPYHLARYRRGGKGLGHLFWELSADRHVPDERWTRVDELKRDDRLTSLDRLVNATVARKALPMRANRILFDHVLLVGARDSWRRQMERVLPRERVSLEADFLESFRAAATERVLLALSDGGVEQLAHVDTNGKAAQAEARATSKSAAAEQAARFLEGMQSPPPNAGNAPHWAAPGG